MESRRLEKRLNERFVKAMATYHLIEDDDRILVGLSGGNDSLLLAELLAKRAKIVHPRFKVEALHVRMENIHYESDTNYLQQFCEELGIKLHVRTTRFNLDQLENLENLDRKRLRRQKQPCFLCSWQRRKELFNLAQQLGSNKIALGHHQDDLILTSLMNLTFQGRFDTMPATLKMRKMPLTIIRPLCMIEEADIKAYAEMRGYQKQAKLCPYEHTSNRTAITSVFKQLQELNPKVRYSLWSALENEGKLTED
jgi:tRNA(Ile)-lysidine synthase TilS/MesJ